MFIFQFLPSNIYTRLVKRHIPRLPDGGQAWLGRARCMSPETKIMPRWHYVDIASRQGKEKLKTKSNVPN